MKPHEKEVYKMKIFPKGQIVLPVHLRRKYHLEIGDQVEVVSQADGLLLKPGTKEIGGKSLTDQLFGVFKPHSSKKTSPAKKDISNATESGFIEGWKECIVQLRSGF